MSTGPMSLLRRTRQGTKDELDGLRNENQRLRQLLMQRTSGTSTQTGYLMKYRPQATSSLWANTWENRYFMIQHQTLAYYRSEQDIHFPPRGKIELLGTYVVQEGLKRRKYHTFNIQERSGAVLIRLSTERYSEMASWMEALEAAGCTLRAEEELASRSRGRSPSPSSPNTSTLSDGRASSPERGGGGGNNSEADSREIRSTTTTSTGMPRVQSDRELLHRKNSGYTSDTSDVGGRAPARMQSIKGGKVSTVQRGCPLVHLQPKSSILSSDRIQVLDSRGVSTLMWIILITTNGRLILENIIKYGLLFNPFSFIKAALTPKGKQSGLLLLCWVVMAINIMFALWIERVAAYLLIKTAGDSSSRHHHHKHNNNPTAVTTTATTEKTKKQRNKAISLFIFTLHVLNIAAALLIPCLVIYHTDNDILPAFALTMICIILWMKLISFAHVNADIRKARLEGHGSSRYRPGERSYRPIQLSGAEELYNYPENLTVGNLVYFLAAPTLCYQLSYPRSSRFRLKWLLRKVFTFGIALGMMLFIMEQYIEPTIDNSMHPMRSMDWLRMLERVLKLSIPTLYYWLAMFYTLFDLWLNIIGELIGFGDREFYREWWNATTVGEYWRLWNVPVHKWMLRHVYYPCIGFGMPKFWAGIIVFFISALLHELLVGVPLHMMKWWAFWGIIFQLPLMWATEAMKRRFKSDTIGNAVFWVSFCIVGQPIAEMMYFHDWRQLHKA